jgi:uncharacterized membrane protein YhhN
MTTIAWLVFVVASLAAVADWIAVAGGRRNLEYVCKPATALLFLATAVVLEPAHGDTRVWFCIALALCAVGDVFLMLPRDAFVAGLASFLVAQVAFAIGFALHPRGTGEVLLGTVVVVALAVPLGYRIVRALLRRGDRSLVGPVVAYMLAISVMVAASVAVANPWGIAGAALFFVSDALIAETRFVAGRSWGPLAVIVTYHCALAGLVLSLSG